MMHFIFDKFNNTLYVLSFSSPQTYILIESHTLILYYNRKLVTIRTSWIIYNAYINTSYCFLYIFIYGGDSMIRFNTVTFYACPKLEPGFPTPYVLVFFVFSGLKWEFVVGIVLVCLCYISGIVNHRYLNFLFTTHLTQ